MANALQYSYKDVNGDVFGPYSAQQMMFWYNNGSLSEELKIFVQPENGERVTTKLKVLIAVNGKEEPFLAEPNTQEEITVVKHKTIKQEIPGDVSAASKDVVSSNNGKSSQAVLRNVKTEVPNDHDLEKNNNSQSVTGPVNNSVVSENQSLSKEKMKTELIPTTSVAIPQNQKSTDKTNPIATSKSVPDSESIQKTQNQSMTKDKVKTELIPAVAVSQNHKFINQTTSAELPETVPVTENVQKIDKDPENLEKTESTVSQAQDTDVSMIKSSESQENQSVEAASLVTSSETVEVAQVKEGELVSNSKDSSTCQKSYGSENVKISSTTTPGDEELQPSKLVPDQRNRQTYAEKSVKIEEEDDDDDIQIIATYEPKKRVVEKATPYLVVPPYKAPVPTTPSDEAPFSTPPSTSSQEDLRPTMRSIHLLPLLGKTLDIDQFLSSDQVDIELFRLVSTIKHLPESYLEEYPKFPEGIRQTCGVCGYRMKELSNLFSHLMSPGHLEKIRKHTISKADIKFWTRKIEKIYLWGRKNCDIDGVQPRKRQTEEKLRTNSDNQTTILHANLATAETLSQLWEKWKGYDNLCFDILVSSNFTRYCDCCKLQFQSPSVRLRHMFSRRHCKMMNSLYDQVDLDNVKNAIETMEKIPPRISGLNKNDWHNTIVAWKRTYERRRESYLPKPSEKTSSSGLMKVNDRQMAGSRRSPPRNDDPEQVPAKRQRRERYPSR